MPRPNFMHRQYLILSLFVVALLLPIPARAADPPPDIAAAVARLPQAERDFLAGAPYAGVWPQSRIVSFSTSGGGGRLLADFHLPDQLLKQFADPKPLILRLEGSTHLWALHRRKAGTLDPGMSYVGLTCWAMTDTGPFQRFTVASDGNSVTVSAQELVGHPLWQSSFQLAQGERSLVVSYRLAADKFQPRRIELPNWSHLPMRFPDLYERVVVPILRRLGGAGRAGADVYRVFDRISADPLVTRDVLRLIARLDADDVAERDATLRELRRMGRPATLATLRLDRAILSPEQTSRLSSLWADEGWAQVGDIEAARKDEPFLESCLEDEDAVVRDAAVNTLATIRAGRLLRAR
jgi:hypothetical protein